MPDYPRVQEWDGAIGLLLNRELDGWLNGVDVLVELFNLVKWEGCQRIIDVPLPEWGVE